MEILSATKSTRTLNNLSWPPKAPLVVESFHGFGDNLFIRPLLIEETKHREVYVQTPYPELFQGTDIRVCKPTPFLYDFANRCMQDARTEWLRPPSSAKFLRPTYSAEQLRQEHSISLSFSAGLSSLKFDTRLKPTEYQLSLGRELVKTDKPICIFKIPSFRHDWLCESRTPKTVYMIECLKMAKAAGYYLVSLQDYTLGDHLENPELESEWMPLADKTLHGKLSVDQLIGLAGISTIIITYPNFLLPLGIFLDKSVFCLYGGSVSPRAIIDPRIGAKHYRYVAPNPFCNCVLPHHDCNKEIPADEIRNKFLGFLEGVGTISDDLQWDETIGYGYYPVSQSNIYNDNYFDKYIGYENTDMGKALNYERIRLANMFSSKQILDIGIGSGMFVDYVDGFGYDVCPKAIDWLMNRDKYVDFYKEGAWRVDLVTFFDSFEHIDDIDKAVKMCMGRTILISIPIFKDKAHVLRSKHYRKDEHYHYFTHDGLIKWFGLRNYEPIYTSDVETKLGREDIETFVFRYKELSVE